jgi:hypothetical protein
MAVKVPLLVAAMMLAIAVVISNFVLKRLSDVHERHLGQLTAAYLDGLSTALQHFVIRRDVWETFDVLDRARTRYAGVGAKYIIVSQPDETVLATLPEGLLGKLRAALD